MQPAEDYETTDGDFFDNLSDADYSAVREALLRELRHIVADAAILEAPPADRLNHASLSDIAETDMQSADVEELIFALTAFGFMAEISIDETFPEGVDERIGVDVFAHGKGTAPGLRAGG